MQSTRESPDLKLHMSRGQRYSKYVGRPTILDRKEEKNKTFHAAYKYQLAW